jgi:RNA polymerase sigma factor (sigma-70 family)
VSAAAAGDEHAWESLVQRFTPALRAAARGFRLPPADVDDVVQSTWLAAFRGIGRLETPEAIGGWLLVTARREALRALQRAAHEVLTDEPPTAPVAAVDSPESLLLDAERRRAVRAAVRRLPRRQRRLLGALLSVPEASYVDIARRLDMPVGSIGPTRERGIGRLRLDDRLVGVVRGSAA